MTLFTGACAFVAAVALWALYFAGSDHLVNRHVETTTDPIYAARLAMNGEIVVVAGLIALAVGNELVIAHPRGDTSLELAPAVVRRTVPVRCSAADGDPSGHSRAGRSYARVGGLAALVVAGACRSSSRRS